jgi:hypothetical protein
VLLADTLGILSNRSPLDRRPGPRLSLIEPPLNLLLCALLLLAYDGNRYRRRPTVSVPSTKVLHSEIISPRHGSALGLPNEAERLRELEGMIMQPGTPPRRSALPHQRG